VVYPVCLWTNFQSIWAATYFIFDSLSDILGNGWVGRKREPLVFFGWVVGMGHYWEAGIMNRVRLLRVFCAFSYAEVCFVDVTVVCSYKVTQQAPVLT